MADVSIFDQVRGSIARFRRSERGNVAVLFAIAIVPILGFVGGAIDYSRVNNARTAMQAALDTAALMISKDATSSMTADQISAKAQTYFNALYKHPEAQSVSISATYTNNASKSQASQVVITGSASMPTDFMKVVGFPTLNFGASSTAVWGNTRMRVAMVLDNTGSMADNGKMAAMQSAAKNMITTLSGYNKSDGDVYISIVPFAKDVNVGTTNVNASWLNWSDWEAEPPILVQKNYPISVKYNSITYTWADIGPGAPCPFDVKNNGGTVPSNTGTLKKYGFACMDRPATTSGATDLSSNSTNRYLIPSSGTYAGMICPGLDSGTNIPGKTSVYYNGCYTSVVDQTILVSSGSSATCPSTTPNCTCSGSGSSKKCNQITYKHYWRTHPTDAAKATAAAPSHSTWQGCITDRDQSYDTLNTAPASSSTQYYPEQWASCLPATVTGMSNQWDTLKTQITNMVPSGNTNQSIGFAWGWQTLNTANDPFKAQPKSADTAYTDYIVLLSDGMNTQNRWSTTASSIDARQAILCKNIKDSGVKIFTIQVNIASADPTSTVLQNCATPGTGNAQMITSATQTATAFENVLTQISKLRIAK